MMDKIGNTPNAHQQWNERVTSILTQQNGDQETTTLHDNVDECYKQSIPEGKRQTNIETTIPLIEFKDRQN